MGLGISIFCELSGFFIIFLKLLKTNVFCEITIVVEIIFLDRKLKFRAPIVSRNISCSYFLQISRLFNRIPTFIFGDSPSIIRVFALTVLYMSENRYRYYLHVVHEQRTRGVRSEKIIRKIFSRVSVIFVLGRSGMPRVSLRDLYARKNVGPKIFRVRKK